MSSIDGDIGNTSVLRGNTWHCKGFSSFNWVFAAILVENGKIIDLKFNSLYCKGWTKKSPKVKNTSA